MVKDSLGLSLDTLISMIPLMKCLEVLKEYFKARVEQNLQNSQEISIRNIYQI